MSTWNNIAKFARSALTARVEGLRELFTEVARFYFPLFKWVLLAALILFALLLPGSEGGISRSLIATLIICGGVVGIMMLPVTLMILLELIVPGITSVHIPDVGLDDGSDYR